MNHTITNFEQLMQLTSDHVYVKNVHGVILACSESQLAFLGLTHSDQLIGKTDYDITTVEAAQKIQALDQQVMNLKQRFESEEIFEKAGQKIYFLSRKEPICDLEGKVIGTMGVSRNITDQKIREKLEAEKIESLKKANDMMRFWAGAIAHESQS